jgi:(1->4)-alpha-D-glucan 1-alpha-D-glucosylmutase
MATPRATYRVQLHAGFTFRQASEIIEYLSDLGVSHLYTSPCLQAVPGSTHGYDVVDFRAVNRELGGEQGFDDLQSSLREHGLGHILDIVPNHMAASCPYNGWWEDLLRHGPSSRYASFFDVYWRKRDEEQPSRILLPLLGDHYEEELRRGSIVLARRDRELRVVYSDHILPVSWSSLAEQLHRASSGAGIAPQPSSAAGYDEKPVAPMKPPEVQESRGHRAEPREESFRKWFHEALGFQPFVREIDSWIHKLNGDADLLDRFLDQQHYRLVYWRTAESTLGYRRFFDINGLVALRMEEPEVFRLTHGLVLHWLRSSCVEGLRIDHPDGLRDPLQYFSRLREAAPHAWIVAEKILIPGERLKPRWPVQGTTGYDFLNQVNGLFVFPEGLRPLTDFYREFTGENRGFQEVLRESKRFAVKRVLGGDLNRLVETLAPLRERRTRLRAFTESQLAEGLTELLACFPVYRTYIGAEAAGVDEDDRRYILQAAAEAKKNAESGVVDYLTSLLLRETGGREGAEFAMRFQQLSGPAMAKGGEDTALYRYFRLTSLCEVGGDPGEFGLPADAFHRLMEERSRKRPASMLATSTHDTKRSEDVRARLNLLTEIPDRWMQAVRRWSSMNERHRNGGFPDRNTEYLLYQTLVGTWPIEHDRIVSYLSKAVREAKVHTSWTEPDQVYESALERFISALFENTSFVEDLRGFVAALTHPGRVNSLAQTLLKLTAPGVPDLYQGTELWDLSLVDPDNRRPVDYGRRVTMLRELETACNTPLEGESFTTTNGPALKGILSRMDDGLPKLWVIRQALFLRKHHPECFGEASSYEPIDASGARNLHAFCFARRAHRVARRASSAARSAGSARNPARQRRVVVLVPRFPLVLDGDWEDTTVSIPAGRYTDLLSGRVWKGGIMPVASLLESFPVALLFCH